MKTQKEERTNHHDLDHQNENDGNQIVGFIAGLLVGGLAGATTMLLLAPQSGKKTRTQIQEKGIDLRDQTVKTVEDMTTHVRGKIRQITDDVHEQTEALKKHGQDVIDEQRDHLSHTLKSWGRAVQV